ncbi:MAG: hypothetical protein VW879_04570 [Opitutae bacterium]
MADPAPKRRSPRKSNPPEPNRTVKPAQEIKNEKAPLMVETPEPKPVTEKKLTPKMTLGDDPYTDDGNRYAPKMKVGTPTIGRSPNFVKTVGLGNLQVTTVNGNSNLRSDSSGSTGTE